MTWLDSMRRSPCIRRCGKRAGISRVSPTRSPAVQTVGGIIALTKSLMRSGIRDGFAPSTRCSKGQQRKKIYKTQLKTGSKARGRNSDQILHKAILVENFGFRLEGTIIRGLMGYLEW